MIDTKKVSDRRQLRFETLTDVVHDAEQLAAGEADGRLRTGGNWSLGQAIGHVAFWVNAPFDGYPEGAAPPWILRFVLRTFLKGKLLNDGMPAGLRIRGVEAGTFGVDPMATADALGQLRPACDRLEGACPECKNPLFGTNLTHQEWKNLNLRHAELHLSFFHVDGA